MEPLLQRWYAYEIFLLRDFCRLISSDGLHEWKARTFITLSEGFLAFAAVLALSVKAGWNVFLHSRGALVVSFVAISGAIYFAHVTAEKHLLHRFEGEFRRLSRAQRIAATMPAVALLVLSVGILLWAATAARHYVGVR
jgi:hypothetical protein